MTSVSEQAGAATGNPEQPELSEQQAIKLKRQLDLWRRDLVALDRRQRLLHFKHTRSASLEIVSPEIDVLLGLVDAGRSVVEPRPEDEETAKPTTRRPTVEPIVVGNKTAKDLPASLRRLDQHSQQ